MTTVLTSLPWSNPHNATVLAKLPSLLAAIADRNPRIDAEIDILGNRLVVAFTGEHLVYLVVDHDDVVWLSDHPTHDYHAVYWTDEDDWQSALPDAIVGYADGALILPHSNR
jgi:hypothetical protein